MQLRRRSFFFSIALTSVCPAAAAAAAALPQILPGAICYHCHVVIAPDRELPESQRDEHARLSLHPLQETISKQYVLARHVCVCASLDSTD